MVIQYIIRYPRSWLELHPQVVFMAGCPRHPWSRRPHHWSLDLRSADRDSSGPHEAGSDVHGILERRTWWEGEHQWGPCYLVLEVLVGTGWHWLALVFKANFGFYAVFGIPVTMRIHGDWSDQVFESLWCAYWYTAPGRLGLLMELLWPASSC